MEQAFVVHIVVEVEVHAGGTIVQQEPARLRECEAVCLWVDQYRAYTERGLQKALHGIVGVARLRAYLLSRQSLVGIAQQVEDAPFHHQSRSLEDDWSPGDELRQPLCLAGTQLFVGILLL